MHASCSVLLLAYACIQVLVHSMLPRWHAMCYPNVACILSIFWCLFISPSVLFCDLARCWFGPWFLVPLFGYPTMVTSCGYTPVSYFPMFQASTSVLYSRKMWSGQGENLFSSHIILWYSYVLVYFQNFPPRLASPRLDNRAGDSMYQNGKCMWINRVPVSISMCVVCVTYTMGLLCYACEL